MRRQSTYEQTRAEEFKILADLGFRRPNGAETRQAIWRKLRKKQSRNKPFSINARRFSTSPLITYSSNVPDSTLGLAGAKDSLLLDKEAWFLISPTWSIENDAEIQKIREAAILHRLLRPGHKFIVLCNTEREVNLVRTAGEAAVLMNKNAFVAQDIFKPLPGAAPEFSAIYNAQLIDWKRHELSLNIEKCAFLFYRADNSPETAEMEKEIMARHAAEAPGHRFLNRISNRDAPIPFPGWEVNKHLNNASVGLCLSDREGAMLASVEYMLAGLPVVSTPSQGGRNIYFDDEYCLTVDADPVAIAQAVDTLKARNIPREYIARKTRSLLDKDRAKFRGLVQRILDAQGSDTALDDSWPQMDMSHAYWVHAPSTTRAILQGERDVFGGTYSKSQPVTKPAPSKVSTPVQTPERPLLTVFQMGYNQAPKIEASLHALLAQTYSPLEIIFSDDCSTDATFEIMQRVAREYKGPHRIILNRNPTNLGIIGNVNRSVELANGALLIQANGDDISYPDRVEKLYQAWSEDPDNIMLVYSEMYRTDQSGQIIDLPYTAPLLHQNPTPLAIVRLNTWVAGSPAAYNPKLFKEFGPLEAPALVEDHILPLRAARLGRFAHVKERLGDWPIGGTSWLDPQAIAHPDNAYFGDNFKMQIRTLLNHKSFLKEYEKGNFEDVEACKKTSLAAIRKINFQATTVTSNQLRLILRTPLAYALSVFFNDTYYFQTHTKFLFRTLPYYRKFRRYLEKESLDQKAP